MKLQITISVCQSPRNVSILRRSRLIGGGQSASMERITMDG